MTVVHRPFLPSVQCGSALPRREKTTRRSCPSNNSSSSSVSFSLLLLSEEPPSALFLGTHPSWNVGVEEEEGRRRSSGEKKKGSFMSQLLRGCRKWGRDFFGLLCSPRPQRQVYPSFSLPPQKRRRKGKRCCYGKMPL